MLRVAVYVILIECFLATIGPNHFAMAQVESTQRKQDHRIKRPLPHFDIGTCLGMEIAQFSPFGWSKDGKFAWINQPPRGESEIFLTQYFIQDMVTDKVLWKGSCVYDISLADSLLGRGVYHVDKF